MVVLSDPEPRSRMNFNSGVSQVDPDLFPLVLLVEDNEDSIETFVAYLEAKGYRMLVARNGQEGISLLKAKHPGLILMDIQMPEMDGLEAMRHIRCLPDFANIPIIALTSLAMEGDQNRCLLAGADSYLSKPVQLKQLVATIQQFLELDFRGRG